MTKEIEKITAGIKLAGSVMRYLLLLVAAQIHNDVHLLKALATYLEKRPELAEYVQEPLLKTKEQMKQNN